MAQKIYIENSVDLESFEEIQRWLGVLQPGVYRGFDEVVFAGLNGTFSHSVTGIEKSNLAADGFSAKTAILITPQGSIVHEDASVVIPVDYNDGNSQNRIDYLVGTHSYQNSPGGVDMVFSIIKGPLEDESEPVLSNPESRILIGKIYIPAGAVDHSGTTYKREKRPGLANQNLEIQSSGDTLNITDVDGSKNLEINTPLLDIADFNDATTPGIYAIQSAVNIYNGPSYSLPLSAVLIVSSADGGIIQQFINLQTIDIRRKSGVTAWTAWQRVGDSQVNALQLEVDGIDDRVISLEEENTSAEFQPSVSSIAGVASLNSLIITAGGITVHQSGNVVLLELRITFDAIFGTTSDGEGFVILGVPAAYVTYFENLFSVQRSELSVVPIVVRDKTSSPQEALPGMWNQYWDPSFSASLYIQFPAGLSSTGTRTIEVTGQITMMLN